MIRRRETTGPRFPMISVIAGTPEEARRYLEQLTPCAVQFVRTHCARHYFEILPMA